MKHKPALAFAVTKETLDTKRKDVNMRLITYVQNVLIGVTLCIFSSYTAHCQTQKPSLFIHYELDSVFKEVLEQTYSHKLEFYIKDTGIILDDNRRNEKHMSLHMSVTGLELNLPDGMYDLRFVIRAGYSIKGLDSYGFEETIYDSLFKYIPVSNANPTTVSFFLKNTCPFRRNVKNDVCPKCGSNEKVIPICKGLPLVDYECYDDPHYSHCSPPACAPTWYCKTDKLEF